VTAASILTPLVLRQFDHAPEQWVLELVVHGAGHAIASVQATDAEDAAHQMAAKVAAAMARPAGSAQADALVSLALDTERRAFLLRAMVLPVFKITRWSGVPGDVAIVEAFDETAARTVLQAMLVEQEIEGAAAAEWVVEAMSRPVAVIHWRD